jgi:transposase InsO family protein
VKAVADTLAEQLRRPERPRRGPYRRAEDEAVLAEIRAITDARPTYGYRRVTALLNRARRSSGEPPLNHKRIFRLMRLSSMLVQPRTGRRPIRAHEGTVVAPASNQRWASDGHESSGCKGELARVAFAIDTHDRGIIAWGPTSGAGICGDVMRDMALDCVGRRFDAIRAPPEGPHACAAYPVELGGAPKDFGPAPNRPNGLGCAFGGAPGSVS